MLPLLKSDRKRRKCQITCGTLPGFIDPLQPPQKSAPFNAVWALKWCHSVDVLLPAELRDVIKQTEARQIALKRLSEQSHKYAKVIMKLGEVLEGDFFTEYVKKGNILMLSEGRPGIDTVFELRDGILHIDVDTPTYERLGLGGKSVRDSGRRHKKNRYTIELNLRPPSMLHGKKGFERLRWACKNVLDQSVTWLFYDCQPAGSATAPNSPGPIEKHHPIWHTIRSTTTEHDNILTPALDSTSIAHSFTTSPSSSRSNTDHDTDYATDLLEYFSLLALGSPRIRANNPVDPFLSRYTPPTFTAVESNVALEPPPQTDVVRLRYHGFIPAAYLIRLLILLTKGLDATNDDKAWGVIQAHGFGGAAVTVLRTSGGARDPPKIDEAKQDMVVNPAEVEKEADEATAVGNESDVEVQESVGEAAIATVLGTKEMKNDKTEKSGALFVCWENPAAL